MMPSYPEKPVGIADKLYQLRRAAHLFYGDNYAEHTGFMKDVLERVQQQQGLDTLQAAMWLAKHVDPIDVREIALIFATAVDIVEPPTQVGKRGE
jgi:hypothetical protein